MHGARAATPARAMHVEEHGTIPFADGRAVDARQVTARLLDHAGGDVAGNDGVRHARQPAVPEMHVSAADLRTQRAEERGPLREIRT